MGDAPTEAALNGGGGGGGGLVKADLPVLHHDSSLCVSAGGLRGDGDHLHGGRPPLSQHVQVQGEGLQRQRSGPVQQDPDHADLREYVPPLFTPDVAARGVITVRQEAETWTTPSGGLALASVSLCRAGKKAKVSFSCTAAHHGAAIFPIFKPNRSSSSILQDYPLTC